MSEHVRLSHYRINDNTLYLKAFLDTEVYRIYTHVVEIKNEYIVHQRPIDLVMNNCRPEFGNYGGVLRPTSKALQSNKMVPTVVSLIRPLTLFPTVAQTRSVDCLFIVNERIDKTVVTLTGCRIIFYSGHELRLDIKKREVVRQRNRSCLALGAMYLNQIRQNAHQKVST